MDDLPKDLQNLIYSYKFEMERAEKWKDVMKQLKEHKKMIYPFNMFRSFLFFDLVYFAEFFPQMAVCERCGNFGQIELIYNNYPATRHNACRCHHELLYLIYNGTYNQPQRI